MASVRPAALILGLVLLGACAPGLARPKVLAGGDTTVSIEAGQWSAAESLAGRYCAHYGKRAVAKGHRRSSGKTLTNVFIYDCKADNR